MSENMPNHPDISKRAEQGGMIHAKNSIVRPPPRQPIQYQCDKAYDCKAKDNWRIK